MNDKGVRHGDSLSSVQLNFILDKAIRAICTNRGASIYNRIEQHMATADDVEFLARNQQVLITGFI